MNVAVASAGWVEVLDTGGGSRCSLAPGPTVKHQPGYTTPPGLWTALDHIVCIVPEGLWWHRSSRHGLYHVVQEQRESGEGLGLRFDTVSQV